MKKEKKMEKEKGGRERERRQRGRDESAAPCEAGQCGRCPGSRRCSLPARARAGCERARASRRGSRGAAPSGGPRARCERASERSCRTLDRARPGSWPGWMGRWGWMQVARAGVRGRSGRDTGRQDRREGEREPARAEEAKGRLGTRQRWERANQ